MAPHCTVFTKLNMHANCLLLQNCTQICLSLPALPSPVSSDILCLGGGFSSPSLLFDTTLSLEVTEGMGPATHSPVSLSRSLPLLLFSVWQKLKETLQVRALGEDRRERRGLNGEVNDPQRPSHLPT